MATQNITLYTAAYLDEADPNYAVGLRAAYRMTVAINDAKQAEVDAAEGQGVTLTGISAVSWDRTVGLDGTPVTLASPPTGLSILVGPVTPDNVTTGRRRVSIDMTPPGADHATRWVGWATIGTVWTGVPVVPPGDVPANYNNPGTGFAILMYLNLAVEGPPYVQSIGIPSWSSVNNGDLTGVNTFFSSSTRGSLKIPAAGTYRFRIAADEGCRLWIDGAILIDDWSTNYGDRFSGAVDFTLNQIVNFRLDHFNSSNANTLAMQWSINGGPYTNLPLTVAYPIGWDEPVAEAPRPVQHAFGAEVAKRYAT